MCLLFASCCRSEALPLGTTPSVAPLTLRRYRYVHVEGLAGFHSDAILSGTDRTPQAALRLLQLLDRPPFLLLQELLYLSLGAVQLAIDRNVKVLFLSAMAEQVGVLGIHTVGMLKWLLCTIFDHMVTQIACRDRDDLQAVESAQLSCGVLVQESLQPCQLLASLQLLEAVVRACWPRMGHHMLPILRRTWEAHKASVLVPELQEAAATAESIFELLATAAPDAFRAVLGMLQESLCVSDSNSEQLGHLLSSLNAASAAHATRAASSSEGSLSQRH